MTYPSYGAAFEPLPQPFAVPPSPEATAPTPAVRNLVASQVHALLTSSAAYHCLPRDQQQEMHDNMNKIAAYSAALAQEEFVQSRRLGQTPMLRQEEVLRPDVQPAPAYSAATAIAPRTPGGRVPLARAAEDRPAADEFSPRAASQVAKITKETLKAIAFPQFVADLIKGTYSAIIDASIKQMEAYSALLKNVAMTVDEFMKNNISDNAARDFVAGSHPDMFEVKVEGKKPVLRVKDGADEKPKPDFKKLYGLNSDPELSDEAAEGELLAGARRYLAKQRQSVLATMVMMGINRIVVTSGRIKATMKFHIDTTDTATAQSASEFDEKNETTASAGGGLFSFFGGGSFETKNTLTYVSTESKSATDEINVSADLGSEVEIKFKSDYFPMEKLANPEMLAAIQGNSANPAANAPPGAKPGAGAPVPAAAPGP